MITCMFVNAKVCESNLIKSVFYICIFTWRLKVLPLVWIKNNLPIRDTGNRCLKLEVNYCINL